MYGVGRSVLPRGSPVPWWSIVVCPKFASLPRVRNSKRVPLNDLAILLLRSVVGSKPRSRMAILHVAWYDRMYNLMQLAVPSADLHSLQQE
jgi:hypothetical protein